MALELDGKSFQERFPPRPVTVPCLNCHKRKGATMRTDTAADWVTTFGRSRATRMNIAEFKTELARLIKKGITAGLSSDDIVDELTEAAEAWRIHEYDPVGDVIASHRP
jgi:hypothetical protein